MTQLRINALAGLIIACTTLGACGDGDTTQSELDGGSGPDAGADQSQDPTYIKASNTGLDDGFAWDLSMSADGNTLAVAALGEDSSAAGLDGDQADNQGIDSGAVYIFVREGDRWLQEAYLKASNPGSEDSFGRSVSLSDDGDTLAVGAIGEASSSTGVDGDQEDDSAERSGAVYVFKRSGSVWSQESYLKASNATSDDLFGSALHLSASGDTLAVGAMAQRDPASFYESGAVYVFQRQAGSWAEEAFLKASNQFHEDLFGIEVRLSSDGNTLAVSAPGEDSSATGVNGDETEDTGPNSGAVYVFTRSNAVWAQQAYLKASNSDIGDLLGLSGLDLSGDGRVLAVGAIGEDSDARGVDGNQDENSESLNSGAVYVFSSTNGQWEQSAYIKASNTNPEDGFGYSISLSDDGASMAVGAPSEDSSGTGSDADQASDSADGAGAVYLFDTSGGAWAQRSYLKASNTNSEDGFGVSLCLSGDGTTLAIGALYESSSAVGVDGDQANNSAPKSGAAYIY